MEMSLPQFHMQSHSLQSHLKLLTVLSISLSHKLESHSQSQSQSLFSLLSISSLCSLNPSLHTLHNPHSFPNPRCCGRHLITTLTASSHFPPWVKPSYALGLNFLVSRLLGIFSSFFIYLFLYFEIWVFHLVQFIENLKIIVLRNCLAVLPQSCMCLIPL